MNRIIRQILSWKHFEYYLLTFLLILGFLVRLYKINNPVADWHSWRQADTASVSRVYTEQGINLLYPRYHDISSIQSGIFNPKGLRMVEFPVYNLVHVSLLKLFGRFSLEVWGRLTSIFSALVSSIFIYGIAKKFMGRWGGILASFFFLFIPYNIYFTRVILPEPMATTFALAGLWFFIKFIESEKTWTLYLSGLFLGLGLLVKPFIFFYLFPLIYLALKKYSIGEILGKPKIFIRFLVFTNLIAVPFFLWRAWINQFPEGIPFFTWAFNAGAIRFRPAFWRWIFGERLGRLILGIWGLVPFAIGLLKANKNKLFNLVFFAGAVCYTIIFAAANVRHDYYQIFIIPAVAMLLAEGSLALWDDKTFNQAVARPLLIFSIILMLGMGAYQVKENYKINHPEIIEAGAAVDKIAPKNALVIAPYNGDTAFLYQTGRWGWPAIDDSIENIIKKGASFYVSVNQGDADTQYIIKRFQAIVKKDNYIIVDLRKPLAK